MSRVRVGSVDGHGRYGVLEYDEAGRPVCHECGRAQADLRRHILRRHGVAAADYRRRHGLPRSVALASELVLGRERARGRAASTSSNKRRPVQRRTTAPSANDTDTFRAAVQH